MITQRVRFHTSYTVNFRKAEALYLPTNLLHLTLPVGLCTFEVIAIFATCLRDLFETVDNHVAIDFIKHIRCYSLLRYLFVRFS